ncbi:5'/3'-nucleotidase SurE [Brevibacillus nitrificans]|uniref:5'-nucleotidase SurE n=1 Tax=Brevibacillus nitrificans TaxID=651560 RepID=A0A3M8D1L2_9BACL|nr:5'/3'-nucleotidase SurE [Brevibacillus nitrificans]RNB81357.1 5'/3'-nucleotidase SurE [Brevibacillus nitrificans]
MNILVTNDDGIFSAGVLSLVKALQPFGNVFVVCPDQERSAISHAITLKSPVKANKVNFFDTSIEAWAVNGTPADCVKMAIEVILKEKPDVVVSGINRGPNLGRDVFYSGTISAAIEGAMYQIPSIAVSLATLKPNASFSIVEPLAYEVFETLFSHKLSAETVLNINLPYLSKEMVKGVAAVPLAMDVLRYQYVGMNDPQGYLCYWLSDNLGELYFEDEESDYFKLRDGFITVTPLQLNMTNIAVKTKISKWFQGVKQSALSASTHD